MATHTDIVSRNGKDDAIADALGVKVHQVRDWRLRNSIPSEQWKAFAECGYASLDELAEAAADEGARKAKEREAQSGRAAA